MSAARALVLAAPGDVLAVAGLPAIGLGSVGAREPAVRTLTRALVPLAPGERAQRLAEAAQAVGVDLERRLAGGLPRRGPVRRLARAGWAVGAPTGTPPNLAR